MQLSTPPAGTLALAGEAGEDHNRAHLHSTTWLAPSATAALQVVSLSEARDFGLDVDGTRPVASKTDPPA